MFQTDDTDADSDDKYSVRLGIRFSFAEDVQLFPFIYLLRTASTSTPFDNTHTIY